MVPPSSREVRGCIDLGDIIAGIVDLSNLDLEPIAAIVDIVLGMTIQAHGPVHVLTVAEYIKALVTYHQEPISDVDRLDILLDHVHILVINRHTLRVHHL